MDDPKQQILTRKKLKELLEQVDPHEAMEAEVENLLLDLSDDFICNVTRSACQMARHRQSEQLEIKDLQLVLENNYNIRIPGFGTEEKPIRKQTLPASHQQRMAQVKKSIAADQMEKEKDKLVRKQSDRL